MLHKACKDGDMEALSSLLSQARLSTTEKNDNSLDVDINGKDQFGSTALHLCCFYGRKDFVDKLLATEGIDVNCKDLFGRTPVFYASKSGHHVSQFFNGR